MRLEGYDYGRSGYYFVTICTKNREHFFGMIVGGDVLIAPRIELSPIGKIVEDTIATIPTVDKYVIMPNHIHIVFRIPLQGDRPMGTSAPTKSIPMAVRFLKRDVTMACGFSVWQRGYHDHIIRNDDDYRRIWEYIDTNPAKWKSDCYYGERENVMAKQEEKTNVMRILDQKGIPYTPHAYDQSAGLDGVSVAKQLGQASECVFKTLVARGASGGLYVFDIPVEDSLDLKKAAKAVGEKSVAMLHQKELLPLTGYVHGGCSPVGMKKRFPTVFDESCLAFGTICVSAGKVGFQVELAPQALLDLTAAATAGLCGEGL